jgi:hypothetical protein
MWGPPYPLDAQLGLLRHLLEGRADEVGADTQRTRRQGQRPVAASLRSGDGRACFHTAVTKGVHVPLFLIVRPVRRHP